MKPAGVSAQIETIEAWGGEPRESVMLRVSAARELVRHDRQRGLAALNDVFRAGRSPEPALDGRYRGQLVAIDVAPGLSQIGAAIAATWMPWQGKRFDAVRAEGDNIFSRDSLAMAKIYWPGYRGFVDDGPNSYRAFPFRTYSGPGKADTDRQVLKIDYDLDGNPGLSIRRVLDELVQVADGYFLGKAHLKWWWGSWQTVAYFSLEAVE